MINFTSAFKGLNELHTFEYWSSTAYFFEERQGIEICINYALHFEVSFSKKKEIFLITQLQENSALAPVVVSDGCPPEPSGVSLGLSCVSSLGNSLYGMDSEKWISGEP